MTVTVNEKVALVTGANRGIGKAIVESLLKHGASKVYLAVRNLASTQELEAQYGDKVSSLQVDVSDAESIKALAQQAEDVNIVVNNAGVLVPAGPFDDHVEDALHKELTVNAFGLLRMANAFANTLEQNGGAFVQLNSIVSIKTFADFTTYSTSKAASYAITQGLKDKFAEKGVAVLSVHPGPIATEMAAKAGFDPSEAEATSTVAEGIIESLHNGDFHLFPDPMAKQFEAGYQSYSDSFITAEAEG